MLDEIGCTVVGCIFCYYFVEYIMNPFACTSSSSMPMILRFGLLVGVGDFLHIPFTGLELFD
jgi:hypothetical protein